MNEIMAKLIKNLEDEINGVINYSEMAKLANAERKPKIAAMMQ